MKDKLLSTIFDKKCFIGLNSSCIKILTDKSEVEFPLLHVVWSILLQVMKLKYAVSVSVFELTSPL